MNEEDVVKKFLEATPCDPEDWITYYTEEEYEGNCLMFEPSRIYGLYRNEDLPNPEFKTYSIEYKPSSIKHFSLLNFGKGMYSVQMLAEILQAFDDHLIEIAEITKKDINVLAFRFYEDWSIVIAERITTEYEIREDGVVFEDEFVEWNNEIAVQKVYGYNKEWKTKVYKKEKIFMLDEGLGDFLDI